MGKGQSKESKKLLEELPCKDWKVVLKQDPSAIDPLCYWIKQYNFNGKLSTAGVRDLQQKIKEKCKQKDNKMRKEGYEQTQVWMKIAGQREEGERRARQGREERKKQDVTEEQKEKENKKETRTSICSTGNGKT